MPFLIPRFPSGQPRTQATSFLALPPPLIATNQRNVTLRYHNLNYLSLTIRVPKKAIGGDGIGPEEEGASTEDYESDDERGTVEEDEDEGGVEGEESEEDQLIEEGETNHEEADTNYEEEGLSDEDNSYSVGSSFDEDEEDRIYHLILNGHSLDGESVAGHGCGCSNSESDSEGESRPSGSDNPVIVLSDDEEDPRNEEVLSFLAREPVTSSTPCRMTFVPLDLDKTTLIEAIFLSAALSVEIADEGQRVAPQLPPLPFILSPQQFDLNVIIGQALDAAMSPGQSVKCIAEVGGFEHERKMPGAWPIAVDTYVYPV